MTSWVRLWGDMPTDPKFRVIARRAGRPISECIAVFVFMMTNAGERNEHNAERGKLTNWSDEDVAAALDIEPAAIESIRDAMQGKTLDGDRLKGWEKRQPKREDGAAERAKAWRERKRTQANAVERPDSDSDSDSDSENKQTAQARETGLLVAAPPDDLKKAFNGSTAAMIADVRSCMAPQGSDAEARKWLASSLTAYGQDAVTAGYHALVTKQGTGEIVPRPLQFWSKVAANVKDAPPPQPGSTARVPAKKRTLHDVVAERLIAQQAAAAVAETARQIKGAS